MASASLAGLSMLRADGTALLMSSLKGRVVAITNVAGFCGFTGSVMATLDATHALMAGQHQPVTFLAFPCNQFANQEPRTACEIAGWVGNAYPSLAAGASGGTFALMAPVMCKGPRIDPLYAALTAARGPVPWNFTTFIVDTHGVPILKLTAGETSPSSLQGALLAALGKR